VTEAEVLFADLRKRLVDDASLQLDVSWSLHKSDQQ